MSSFKAYFFFTQGLSQTITVPSGTKEMIAKHVSYVEESLGLKKIEAPDGNSAYWDCPPNKFKSIEIDDKILCSVVETHNIWVRQLYEYFEKWVQNPPGGNTEQLTPDDAKTFWHALTILDVPPERWSRNYYKSRMEHFYEVLRGREDEGVEIGCKPLTTKQANAVIWLFSFLDKHDIRLEVPKGGDELRSADDGGYDWCEKCGAVYPEDAGACSKRKCPLKEFYES